MKVAVITGAGSGVGQALAVELAQRGWYLGLLGHGEIALRQTGEQIEALGAAFCIQVVDVADATQVDTAATAILDRFGKIDAWINAAAVAIFGPVADMVSEDLDRVMAVSYNGVVHGSRAAALAMTKAHSGVILNVGSSLAFATVPYNVPYAAAKAASRSFSLGLGTELCGTGVTVCVAHLPAVATPWFAKVKTLTKFQSRPVGVMHAPASVARGLANLVERPHSGDCYLGLSTIFVVLGARIFPRLTAWFAARLGVRLQSTKLTAPTSDNLWAPVEPPMATPPTFRVAHHVPRQWPPR